MGTSCWFWRMKMMSTMSSRKPTISAIQVLAAKEPFTLPDSSRVVSYSTELGAVSTAPVVSGVVASGAE